MNAYSLQDRDDRAMAELADEQEQRLSAALERIIVAGAHYHDCHAIAAALGLGAAFERTYARLSPYRVG